MCKIGIFSNLEISFFFNLSKIYFAKVPKLPKEFYMYNLYQFNHKIFKTFWKFICNIRYYTTQAVRGPITKINQSKCSIAGPIFSKYWTRHCREWSCTCVFAVFALFSRVINLLLTKLARYRTGRISALCLFCTDLAALGLYCQDLGPIFSQYGPHAWLIRYIYRDGKRHS